MKHKKLYALVALLLVAALAAGMGILASADSDTPEAIYTQSQNAFVFNHTAGGSDLFVNFKDMMPGDGQTQQISIGTATDNTGSFNLYLKLEAVQEAKNASGETIKDAEGKTFTDYVSVTVTSGDDTLGDKTGTSFEPNNDGWIALGSFDPGSELTVTAQVRFDLAMGNAFQGADAVMQWLFRAEQASGGNDSGGTVLPQPGKTADIPETPAEEESSMEDEPVPLEVLTTDHINYLMGYEDGSVHPQGNITRAEVAAIFFRLLTDEVRDSYLTEESAFSDVARGAWYNTQVSTLCSVGIVQGYPDGTFRPDAAITRAELAAIIARFADMAGGVELVFTDISGHWAMNAILLAASNGWIQGYEDGSFRPDQAITRAETVTMLNRVLDRLPAGPEALLEGMQTFPDNLDEGAWYYYAIQEATNNHTYRAGPDGEVWTGRLEDIDWTRYQY